MKSRIAAIAIWGCLASVPAGAQTPPAAGRVPSAPPPSTGGSYSTQAATPPAGQPKEYAADAIPGPTLEEDLKPVSIALPNDPLEPYLLTKQNGPFMVLAQVFRGVDSERLALALCKELREEYHLPAYILRSKEFPMKSYIRGTPVQAPSETTKSAIKLPERIRIQDEAAVLVGDEKTEQGTEALLHKVRKIYPKCLKHMPRLFAWRDGSLYRAIRTTNPYVPAQWLFPRPPDKLMIQMNSGLRSIAHCPGHYTIQVAQFAGHTAYNLSGGEESKFDKFINERKSPLRTAHDDAERLADRLAAMPEVKQLGLPVFVYHDRTTSRVYVGSFNSADDPNASAVHQELIRVAAKANSALQPTNRWKKPQSDMQVLPASLASQMIVPAAMLTNVDDLKKTIQ